jgi:ribosomal protein S18 acetylase RimI-like enzyme
MAKQTGSYGIVNQFPDLHASPSSQFSCIPLTESMAEQAARLYTEVFLADEPTTRHHAPDPEFFLTHARFYVRSLAGKQLSFLVRDDTTRELAGFIFCVDMTDDPKSEGASMEEFLAYFKETVAIIDELEGRYLTVKEIRSGSVLHIFQIGVSRKDRGCGIAQALIHRVLADARERGFRQVIADCTGPVSRRAFEQCGFAQAGYIPYETFSHNGARFFTGIDGGISLMTRDV